MPATRSELLAIAAGGAAGALMRVGLSQELRSGAGHWPWATFAANVLGAFLLGALLAHLRRRDVESVLHYRLLGTGLLSTFTTFSTVQLELLRMLDASDYGLAAGYILATVAAGYVGVLASARLIARIGISGS